MRKKPIYGGRIYLITDTAEITSADFPELTRNSKVLSEPHRIWLFFRTPSLFCHYYAIVRSMLYEVMPLSSVDCFARGDI